ncbi:MAG TPA: tol-pal system protein YbgF [Aestuariivirgaceae bacterium]
MTRTRFPRASREAFRSIAAAVSLLLLAGGASAQEEPSLAVRMSVMEDQMRQLYGQIEQLNIQMMQLNEQMQRLEQGGRGKQKTSETPVPAAPDGEEPLDGQVIVEAPSAPDSQAPDNDLYAYQTGALEQGSASGEDIVGGLQQAPGPQPLGTLPAAPDTIVQDGDPAQGGAIAADPGQPVVPESVETASLDSAAPPQADTPEKLYELSYESLLRRRYGEAEAGFRSFVQKHPEHELAGNAGFWLGETYYVQSNYKAAAQAFLSGFQKYPDNRKAPDSLLRLGMSLKQLGQKEQACAAFATVETKFPKAGETRKRAQDESEKAGC